MVEVDGFVLDVALRLRSFLPARMLPVLEQRSPLDPAQFENQKVKSKLKKKIKFCCQLSNEFCSVLLLLFQKHASFAAIARGLKLVQQGTPVAGDKPLIESFVVALEVQL